jgi:hypothetical protein
MAGEQPPSEVDIGLLAAELDSSATGFVTHADLAQLWCRLPPEVACLLSPGAAGLDAERRERQLRERERRREQRKRLCRQLQEFCARHGELIAAALVVITVLGVLLAEHDIVIDAFAAVATAIGALPTALAALLLFALIVAGSFVPLPVSPLATLASVRASSRLALPRHATHSSGRAAPGWTERGLSLSHTVPARGSPVL